MKSLNLWKFCWILIVFCMFSLLGALIAFGSGKRWYRPHYDLIAFVTTSSDVSKIEPLRRQWKNSLTRLDPKYRVKLVFITGLYDKDGKKRPDDELDRIMDHSEGDIVIAPVPDSQHSIGIYCPVVPVSSTTVKVLWSMKWLTSRYRFDYVVRLGDDAYFRVDYYLNEIAKTLPKRLLYHGHFWGPLPCDSHISGAKFKYALGMGYVMTYDLAEWIAKYDQDKAVIVEPEDAVVGLWLLGINANRVHDERFHNVRQLYGVTPSVLPDHTPVHIDCRPHAWRECQEDSILLHYVTGSLWDSIDQSTGIINCTKEAICEFQHKQGLPCPRCPDGGYEIETRSGLDMYKSYLQSCNSLVYWTEWNKSKPKKSLKKSKPKPQFQFDKMNDLIT